MYGIGIGGNGAGVFVATVTTLGVHAVVVVLVVRTIRLTFFTCRAGVCRAILRDFTRFFA